MSESKEERTGENQDNKAGQEKERNGEGVRRREEKMCDEEPGVEESRSNSSRYISE